MLKSLMKDIVIRCDLLSAAYLLPSYNYNFQPAHLAFLCECIDRTRALPGPIVEVGCDAGWTTVFLNKHMDFSKIEKSYFCIDTFSGFTPDDIRYERQRRGKDPTFPSGAFSRNKKEWFDRTMQINGIKRVRSIQGDVNRYDFEGIKDVSVCLIDVDLYLPVKAALEKVYGRMAAGGVLVVDDCAPDSPFDGALQAYREFVEAHRLPEKIILEKLGVIEVGTS